MQVVTSDRVAKAKSRGPTWRTTNEAGVVVHWTPVHYENRMSYFARVRAFFQFAIRSSIKAYKLEGDLVFGTSTPLTIAIPAYIASKFRRRPMVFEVRDLWPAVPIAIGAIKNPVTKMLARALERFAYRNSEEVVALAPGMKEAVAETGYPESRITVIPNGADNKIFSQSDNDESDIRGKFDWLGEKPLLLYCGALGRVNGVEYLANVAGSMKDINPDVRFVVVGDGAQHELVENTASEQGVLNKTFFMMGQVPKNEATHWLRTSTMTVALFTGPSIIWKDATQNKFFDSLAAGKPIVCNFNGWQCQIAQEHDVGLIASKSDYEAAARAINERLEDQAWMDNASSTAKSLAKTTYSMDTHAKSLEEVLKRAYRSWNEKR